MIYTFHPSQDTVQVTQQGLLMKLFPEDQIEFTTTIPNGNTLDFQYEVKFE